MVGNYGNLSINTLRGATYPHQKREAQQLLNNQPPHPFPLTKPPLTSQSKPRPFIKIKPVMWGGKHPAGINIFGAFHQGLIGNNYE
ncbi:hypothetical protein AVEN_26974-1 [Araneus ventricosus]|uniref:Uncharacterized protein n=1 Tax=Araneus ventricosus TaxID=182803 RepID=A0A4Y2K7C6_ARAVE|nr:hypothetical protein AVEN_26974-1 [Araneus ventricosus]